MENPVVYLGAALVLMAIGVVVGRMTKSWDRGDAASLARELKRVEDTRGLLQTYVQIMEAHAAGDGAYLWALNGRLQTNPYPRFDPLVIADPELIEALSVVSLEIWRAGFGAGETTPTVMKIGRIRTAVNRAMDHQEQRAIDGKDLDKITKAQAEQLSSRLTEVLAAFSRATEKDS